jgi:hypothetical protein
MDPFITGLLYTYGSLTIIISCLNFTNYLHQLKEQIEVEEKIKNLKYNETDEELQAEQRILFVCVGPVENNPYNYFKCNQSYKKKVD